MVVAHDGLKLKMPAIFVCVRAFHSLKIDNGHKDRCQCQYESFGTAGMKKGS